MCPRGGSSCRRQCCLHAVLFLTVGMQTDIPRTWISGHMCFCSLGCQSRNPLFCLLDWGSGAPGVVVSTGHSSTHRVSTQGQGDNLGIVLGDAKHCWRGETAFCLVFLIICPHKCLAPWLPSGQEGKTNIFFFPVQLNFLKRNQCAERDVLSFKLRSQVASLY